MCIAVWILGGFASSLAVNTISFINESTAYGVLPLLYKLSSVAAKSRFDTWYMVLMKKTVLHMLSCINNVLLHLRHMFSCKNIYKLEL